MTLVGSIGFQGPPLAVGEYDSDSDEIEIEGIKYSGMLFRSWGTSVMGRRPGALFRIVSRSEDGMLVIGVEEEPRTRLGRAWASLWRKVS